VSNNKTEYECIGFHDCLPKGKASGGIRIESHEICFDIDNLQVRASLAGLTVSLGGASNRLVFFEHPQLNGWSFYTSDLAVLQDHHLLNQPEIAAVLLRAKQKRLFGWGLVATVVAICLAVPLLLVFRMDVITGVIAQKIPPSWEQQLGESTMAQYQLGKDVMSEKEANTLLSPLTMPLTDALDQSPYQYHFYIVNDSSLNAFALPGGEVIIHSALILRAESAEELLGVLAHEITHVEEQHGLRGVIGATGIYMLASAVFGDVSGIMATLSGAAPLLLNQSYSRRFETEADLKGFALLQRADIYPGGLASFFEKMIAEEKKQLEKIEDEENRELIKSAMRFLSTHPASEDRIEKLNELGQADNRYIGDYRNFKTEFSALQKAVEQFVTENEDENSDEE
jgi:Zn-dependent protease with chaperone function